MKNRKTKKYIIIIATALVIIGILIFVAYKLNVSNKINNEEPKINETTVDYYTLEDELIVENINAEKTIIYEELLKHGEYDINPEYMHKNILYGTYISKELMNIILLTKGVWSYNIETKTFNYYSYPDDSRIWDIYITGNYIYYVELKEKFEDNVYEWSLIKSDLNFENKIVIKNGKVSSPLDAPIFAIDQMTDKVYVYTVNDEIINETEIIKSTFQISILENDELKVLVENSGSHSEKTGTFSCQANYTFKVYNDELSYCEVSYYDDEKIKILNLSTDKTKTIYTNEDLDNWQISEVQIGNEAYLITQISKDTDLKGKIINVSKKNNVINITNANGYKISRLLNINDDFVINSNKSFAIFSTTKNSYIKKFNINANDYMPFYISNGNNTLILENKKDKNIYVMSAN